MTSTPTPAPRADADTDADANRSAGRDTVRIDRDGPVWTVTIDRPGARNAVDRPTARSLADAFRAFDADAEACVAVLTGAGGTFCAGADLKAIAGGLDDGDDAATARATRSDDRRADRSADRRANRLDDDMRADGPMGPTRMQLRKPVIAAIEGHAVAGGLELALWCDLRVAARGAIFGVYCRRFGVPLIDGGTVRLPRLIGMSRALDLVITGRPVDATEAHAIGLANRLVDDGTALDHALTLAREIARLPQHCLRNDRASVHAQHALPVAAALAQEFALGRQSLASGEAVSGARRFGEGIGRHGGRE